MATPDEPTADQLRRDPLPLRGRVALVTGVSRRVGIGYAVARRLAALGASLFLHHYAPHDRDQPWGDDPGGAEAVVTGVRSVLAARRRRSHMELDLAAPDAPASSSEAAAEARGHLDILVCNHAAAAATARSARWTPPCSTRTGPSTPAPRSCSLRPSPPGTTAGPAAGSSS